MALSDIEGVDRYLIGGMGTHIGQVTCGRKRLNTVFGVFELVEDKKFQIPSS